MTDLEQQILEHRALLADMRSQLALNVVTALRRALAVYFRDFDAEYLRQVANTPLVSLPADNVLSSPSKIQALIDELQDQTRGAL